MKLFKKENFNKNLFANSILIGAAIGAFIYILLFILK
jgi:hypothetical protein